MTIFYELKISAELSKPLISAFQLKSEINVSHIPAIKCGREQEANGLKEFQAVMNPHHSNLTIRRAGLYVKPALPYIGASPDAVLTCDCPCHGFSIVEIKCPFKLKGLNIKESYHLVDYLTKSDNGGINIEERT